MQRVPTMKDQARTKDELIHELRELRAQIKTVEASKIKLRRAKAEIQEARGYAENIVETVREPLLVLDGDLKIVSANRSFYRTFKVTPSNTLGRLVYDLGNRQWDIPGSGFYLRRFCLKKPILVALKLSMIFLP